MMDKKLEHLFYAFFGGALMVKEKLESNREELKAWQVKSEESARTLLNELAQRGEKEKEQFRNMFKELFKEVVSELNLATKQDLENLKKELEK
jgi:polyhydroxyalkanoate synthesis regulator phasin